ncbi:MAG TPA: hypothetical protein VK593_08470 [Edaphobacter sp.]|nr:hypothetical protein [Edaphobacter sp.]
MPEISPEQKIDALIDALTADDGTLSEEGKIKAAALRRKWEDFRDIVHAGELKVLMVIEQQKVYKADRDEAEDDDEGKGTSRR